MKQTHPYNTEEAWGNWETPWPMTCDHILGGTGMSKTPRNIFYRFSPGQPWESWSKGQIFENTGLLQMNTILIAERHK